MNARAAKLREQSVGTRPYVSTEWAEFMTDFQNEIINAARAAR